MNINNTCNIIGRLTADPELRQTQNGIASCRFTVAVNRPKQKDKPQEADFITVSSWRQTAELVAKYFRKGSPIHVAGSIRNNNYTDANGVKHYTMELLADNVGFLPQNKSENQPGSTQNSRAPSQNPPVGTLADFEEILSDGAVPF